MIAVTSISPVHINFAQQVKAIKSWQALGIKVLAVQHRYDIEKLKINEFYPGVTFIPTIDTMEKVFEKPFVKINTLIDIGYAYGDEVVMLINSDIILKDSWGLLNDIINLVKINESFVYVSRWNYRTEAEALLEQWGIDAFIFNRKHLKLIPQGSYCMGQPRWDHWIPMHVMKHNIPMYHVKSRFAYHLIHEQQWSQQAWRLCSEWYMLEMGVSFDDLPNVFRTEHGKFTAKSIII